MKNIALLLVFLFISILTTQPLQASSNAKIEQLCAIDCKSEFMFFRRYAEQGSSLAELSLAIMYLRGQGTEVNIPVGKRFLMRAAKAGEPGAQYQLGYLLMYGIYMPQDIEKSLGWFKRAVKSKVPGAQQKVNSIENMLDTKGIKGVNEHYAKQLLTSPEGSDSEQHIEVITVTFEANYKHILEAARAQTCNSDNYSCHLKWNSVIAPIIVLQKDVIQ